MDVKNLLDNRRGGQAGKFLKGSDVPAGTKTITIQVGEVRQSPQGFSSLVIIALKKPVCGKSEWPPNVTNLELIGKKLGYETDEWKGKKIKLDVISVRNPKTNEMVPGLAVSA